jgi:glycosyltransferase involved in cell wall biosynthesis
MPDRLPATAHAPFREVIAPVEESVARPLWSVMIPTYNCAAYLRETLESVLAQDPGPERMQIQVVDDHSTADDPEAVARELGRGRVEFHRQPRNIGHTRNFDTCIRLARGRLVHILHGDDRVLPGFYRTLEAAFDADPEIGAAFCRVQVVDQAGNPRYEVPPLQPESGRVARGPRVMAVEQPVETPSIVVRREVYEALGGFDGRLRSCGEDLEMWVRIAARYPVWYEVEPLAVYRTHPRSLSGASFRTGQNIRDVRLAIETCRASLPRDEADEIAAQAKERAALWALAIAVDAITARDLATARVQVREALACSRTARVRKAARDVVLYALRREARVLARRIRKLPGRLLRPAAASVDPE